VVNGLLGKPGPLPLRSLPAVGVVPGGSANVFARSLGIPQDPIDATNLLVDLLSTHRRTGVWRRIGLMDCGERWGVFTAGMGVDGEVVAAVEERRKHTTGVPGVHFVFVSNSSPWTYANKRPVWTNPDTGFETGLGVFATTSMSIWRNLGLVRQMLAKRPKLAAAHLIREDDVAWVRVSSDTPVASQIDGDYIGLREQLTFRSVPDALAVVAPLV